MCVSRDGYPVILPVGKNSANRLFRIGERFFLVISLSDNFRQSGNENGKAALGLWLQNDREAIIGHCGVLLIGCT